MTAIISIILRRNKEIKKIIATNKKIENEEQ